MLDNENISIKLSELPKPLHEDSLKKWIYQNKDILKSIESNGQIDVNSEIILTAKKELGNIDSEYFNRSFNNLYLLVNSTNGSPDLSSSSESSTANTIGAIVLYGSLIAGLICVFTLGRIEVVTGTYYPTIEKAWSIPVVIGCIAMGLNGMFFGYLLQKVASILRYHEQN